MKLQDIHEEDERGYIRSVNMDLDYQVSPEAGNISQVLCEDNDSDDWFVTVLSVRSRIANAKNKRKRKLTSRMA